MKHMVKTDSEFVADRIIVVKFNPNSKTKKVGEIYMHLYDALCVFNSGSYMSVKMDNCYENAEYDYENEIMTAIMTIYTRPEYVNDILKYLDKNSEHIYRIDISEDCKLKAYVHSREAESEQE